MSNRLLRFTQRPRADRPMTAQRRKSCPRSAAALLFLSTACDEPEGHARAATTEAGARLHWVKPTIELHLSPERPGGSVLPLVQDAVSRAAQIWNDALDECRAPRLTVVAPLTGRGSKRSRERAFFTKWPGALSRRLMLMVALLHGRHAQSRVVSAPSGVAIAALIGWFSGRPGDHRASLPSSVDVDSRCKCMSKGALG